MSQAVFWPLWVPCPVHSFTPTHSGACRTFSLTNSLHAHTLTYYFVLFLLLPYLLTSTRAHERTNSLTHTHAVTHSASTDRRPLANPLSSECTGGAFAGFHQRSRDLSSLQKAGEQRGVKREPPCCFVCKTSHTVPSVWLVGCESISPLRVKQVHACVEWARARHLEWGGICRAALESFHLFRLSFVVFFCFCFVTGRTKQGEWRVGKGSLDCW